MIIYTPNRRYLATLKPHFQDEHTFEWIPNLHPYGIDIHDGNAPLVGHIIIHNPNNQRTIYNAPFSRFKQAIIDHHRDYNIQELPF